VIPTKVVGLVVLPEVLGISRAEWVVAAREVAWAAGGPEDSTESKTRLLRAMVVFGKVVVVTGVTETLGVPKYSWVLILSPQCS
jgi:hypothetical protein